jgi:LPS-assembly lipoprotein
MSSLDRRSLLLLPLALAACGFTPAYGPKGSAKHLQGAIHAVDPTDKNGFDLVERIEQQFGPPVDPRYDLTYQISVTSSGVGITPDNAITLYNLAGEVNWELIDRNSGDRLTGGMVQSFTTYSATGVTVSGLTAEDDAALRLMRILADQIVIRILATSSDWAK